jgi:hypothetical protein
MQLALSPCCMSLRCNGTLHVPTALLPRCRRCYTVLLSQAGNGVPAELAAARELVAGGYLRAPQELVEVRVC